MTTADGKPDDEAIMASVRRFGGRAVMARIDEIAAPTEVATLRKRVADLEGALERLDQRETELMGELSGVDQMNLILAGLVRRAMKLLPSGKSLWWDEAEAAIKLVDEAAALKQGTPS